MPIYFRAPLPGPFVYSKRVSMPRIRLTRRYRPTNLSGGAAATLFFAFAVLVALTVEAWFVMIPLYIVVGTVWMLRRRKNASR